MGRFSRSVEEDTTAENTSWSFDNVTNNGTISQNTTSPSMQFYREEQIVFLSLLLVLIIIGNVSVLLAIGLSKRRHRSRMNFFIMHLAIADLSVGLLSVLPDLIWKITIGWYAGNVMCKLVRYFQVVVTYASTYVLVALSIDRLEAIARPMSFSKSGLRGKVLIGTAWALSIVFSAPMLPLNKEIVYRGNIICYLAIDDRWKWKVYMTLIVVALFILPAIIITLCYVIIISIIWRKSKLLVPTSKRSPKKFISGKCNGTQSSDSKGCLRDGGLRESKTSSRGVIPQAKIRTVKMTLVIVLVFIMCWSPYFIYDLLDIYGFIPNSKNKFAVSVLFQSLAPLNSLFNPVIYGIFSTRICQNLRRITFCDWFITRMCFFCARSQDRTADRATSVYSSSTYTTHMDDGLRGRLSSSGNRRKPPISHLNTSDGETEILMTNLNGDKTLITNSQCQDTFS